MTKDKMGKKKGVENEVRDAVREYLQELIGDRTGAGKGMAVTANDLLDASKAGANKAYNKSNLLDEIMEKIRNPPEQSNKPGYMGHTRASRCKSADPAMDRNGKPTKSDINRYHWMVWKTGRTPDPDTTNDEFTSNSPAPPYYPCQTGPIDRPTSAASCHPRPPSVPPPRPASARPRTTTPGPRARTATPAMRPETPAYEGFLDGDDDDELRNIGNRAPTPDAKRILTPQPAHRPPAYRPQSITPSMLAPRAPYANHPIVKEENTNMSNVNMHHYAPSFNAWISNADEYEKTVAYNLLKALEGGSGNPPTIPKMPHPKNNMAFQRQQMRPKSASKTRTLGRQRIARPPTAGVRTCIPLYKIYEQAERLNINNNPFNALARGPVDAVPLKGYIHPGSQFAHANKPYRSDFSINPEWVSEDIVRKKNAQKVGKSTFVVHPEWVSESAPGPDLRQQQLEAQVRSTRAERL